VGRSIPRSLVLIGMADQLGRSVGDMYEGAFVPGVALAGLYAVYVFIMTLVFPKSAPGLPPEDLIHKEPDGRRGVWQLGLLTVFSGVVGYYIMAQTQVKSGADFVILTMSVSIVVSFVSAVLSRFFGSRNVVLVAALTAAIAAVGYGLQQTGWERSSLFAQALAAGALYALIAAA